jgi:hypothetical protein
MQAVVEPRPGHPRWLARFIDEVQKKIFFVLPLFQIVVALAFLDS